jgi:hypothetical protein
MPHDELSDWQAKTEDLLAWTGSAFLAGETHPSDGEDKGQLYSFLCSLVGYLATGEECEQRLTTMQAREATLIREREWQPIETFDALRQKDRPRYAAFYFSSETAGRNALPSTVQFSRNYGMRTCTRWLALPDPEALGTGGLEP